MISNYVIWTILFFAVIGFLMVSRDVFNLLCRVTRWIWTYTKSVYSRHPIRRARCKCFFKKYKADFDTCDIMFNSDYRAMRKYVVKNRKKL